MTTAIPSWLQWVWAFAGLTVAVGGFIWIVAIFWPLLRWQKDRTIEGLEISRKANENLKHLQEELVPAINELKEAIAEARKKKVDDVISNL